MFKKLLLLTVCLVLFHYGGLQAADSSVNLIGNPSFEEPLKENGSVDQWTNRLGLKEGIELDTSESYHGSQSLLLANAVNKGLVVMTSEKQIPAVPEEQYTLVGYIKTDMDSLNPAEPAEKISKMAYFVLQTFNEEGGWGPAKETQPILSVTTSDWKECRVENFVIPPKTKTISVWCVVNGGYIKAWFDNVSLVKVK